MPNQHALATATLLARSFVARLRAVSADRRGAIGVAAGLLFVPVVMVTGAAVDYARVEQFKTQLQATVDSAALSGAAAYVGASDSSTAETVAGNYITANENLLPSHIGTITDTVGASQVSTGSNQGYTVTVNATGTIGTTFMRLVEPSMTVSASATAVNPMVTITLTANGFKSSAADGNTLYYWLISGNNTSTVPNPNNFAASQMLASNIPGASNNQPVTLTVSASQQIGIALNNITGDLANYGCNQYQTAPAGQWERVNYQYQYVAGTCQGSTQWFFSNVMPPSNNYYDTTANNSDDTGYAAVAQNCSLITATSSSIPSTLTPPYGGSCYNSLPANSLFSCSTANGQYITYYWNDMGGNPDDKDYNDAEISISCSSVSGGNNATGVYLAS